MSAEVVGMEVLTAVATVSSNIWDKPRSIMLKIIDVSKAHVASIFRFKNKPRKKPAHFLYFEKLKEDYEVTLL
jgi:hypothetical protein